VTFPAGQKSRFPENGTKKRTQIPGAAIGVLLETVAIEGLAVLCAGGCESDGGGSMDIVTAATVEMVVPPEGIAVTDTLTDTAVETTVPTAICLSTSTRRPSARFNDTYRQKVVWSFVVWLVNLLLKYHPKHSRCRQQNQQQFPPHLQRFRWY